MKYEYKGFEISGSDYSDVFTVRNYHTGFSGEFESFDAACDWIDDQVDEMDAEEEREREEQEEEDMPIHTYLFFYVDNATDQPSQAYIKAKNYDEAVDILYADYDVYQIADYDVLD